MALTQEQLDAVKNKYLDGEGLAHLWEKVKEEVELNSAKIILVENWTTGLFSINNDTYKKWIEDAATYDVMIHDLTAKRRYYYLKPGGVNNVNRIWFNIENNSTVNIITAMPSGTSGGYALSKSTWDYHAATADSATTATYAGSVGNSSGSLNYDTLKQLDTNAVRATNTFGNNEIIVADGSTRNVKSSGMTFSELIKIAEGKTKAYVIGEFTSATGQGKAVLNDQFETNDDDIVLSIRSTTTEGSTTWAGFQDPNGDFVSLEDLKIGDIVLLKESNYPDRWVSNIESKQSYAKATFTSLEADKVDLNGYVTGSGLTSNNIILGNGDSKIQASTYSIGGSVKNDNTAGKTVPTNKAIIDYVQPKITTIGGKNAPIYVDSNNVIQECNQYAGGTAVTFNATSKAGSTASFFAPTGAGNSGQILKSSGGEPTWVDQSTLSVGSVQNSLTFNSGGSGAASGTTYNGSAAKTISYNTIGAVNTATSTGAGTLWQATIIKNEATDTSSTAPTDPEINLTAKSKLVTGGGTAIKITYDVNQELKVNKTGVILSSSRTNTSSSTKTEKYLTFNFNGFTYTKGGSTYKIVDTSMTLTTDDIDTIINNTD